MLPRGTKPTQCSRLSCTGPPQIGFVFDHREDAWEQSFQELRLFAKDNGGKAHVATLDPKRQELGRWCNNQARDDPPTNET